MALWMTNAALLVIVAIFLNGAHSVVVRHRPSNQKLPNSALASCISTCTDRNLLRYNDADKWGKIKALSTGPKLCFGNQKGTLLFSRQFTYNYPVQNHHVAILCRVATNTATIDGGAVFGLNSNLKVEVKNFVKTPKEVIFLMNGKTESHTINMSVAFWTNGKKENPTVECVGYGKGKMRCEYSDVPTPPGAVITC